MHFESSGEGDLGFAVAKTCFFGLGQLLLRSCFLAFAPKHCGEEQPKLYSCHHRQSSTLKVTLAREMKIQVYLSIDN